MHVRPRRRAAWLPALALILGTAGCAQSAVSAGGTPDEQLQDLLDRWRQRADVPAMTLAVDGPGRNTLVTASGTEARDGDTPPTASAQFRVASITKLFVATVVLQLVEEGRLGLDDPVAVYIPDFRHVRDVTIRQLLNHTSGIPDYTRTEHFHEGLLEHRDHVWSTDELLGLVADVRRDFAPGTDYLYSNTGYLLLGRVIDTVTGSTWAAEVRRRIFEPLRLQHTYVAGAEPVPGGVLPGYIDVDMDGDVENVETGRPWPALETAEGPAGAVVSTAGDLAVFADALFRGRLLSASTLKQMVAEGAHHPRNANYGLGVEISRPDYRLTVWGHGGFTIGFKSTLWYMPQQDLVVVVLANDARANTSDLAELVARTEAAERDA
ncbi:MAG TPA: serine hydrolase domain-containing protein [Jiangellaceae bacterium]|nr:serine hydrolase domain-containing protein [Jiangellaceae bacterium]